MMTSAEYHRRLTALLARPMFGYKKSIGFDIPRGWLDLVERLVADPKALPNGGLLRCIQVKEKFGGCDSTYPPSRPGSISSRPIAS